ncbi:MAG: hypothetical protein ACTSUE_04000 [Promethearchaeota archaeon]
MSQYIKEMERSTSWLWIRPQSFDRIDKKQRDLWIKNSKSKLDLRSNTAYTCSSSTLYPEEMFVKNARIIDADFDNALMEERKTMSQNLESILVMCTKAEQCTFVNSIPIEIFNGIVTGFFATKDFILVCLYKTFEKDVLFKKQLLNPKVLTGFNERTLNLINSIFRTEAVCAIKTEVKTRAASMKMKDDDWIDFVWRENGGNRVCCFLDPESNQGKAISGRVHDVVSDECKNKFYLAGVEQHALVRSWK